ncbi:hypothetical protein K3495_g7462 [Podosphaera aphanis]|nr:hypothetical protein K3495_g7462 [Podosphaera aphanis]
MSSSSSHSALHSLPPSSRNLMSITNTYYLAHTARNKLAYEASRSDHRLLRLVGHANLLDSLMIKLSRTEEDVQSQQQDYSVVRRTTSRSDRSQHIQWADCVVENAEEDWQSSDADSSDSESDYDSDEEMEMEADIISLRRVMSHKISPAVPHLDDVDEDYEVVELPHNQCSIQPPELDHDSDSSEDDIMPPTPTTIVLPSFQAQPSKQFYSDSDSPPTVIPPSEQQAFFDDGFYLPSRKEENLASVIRVC